MLERYSTTEFKELWSEKNKYIVWFLVEYEAAKAMVSLDIIPAEVEKQLETFYNDIDKQLSLNKILELESKFKHDVIAFVTYLESQLGLHGKWIHYGLTSSDVVDTGLALLLVKASNLILDKLNVVIEALSIKCNVYSKTIMLGRTHGMYAEPITFGSMLAGHLAEFKRNRQRLKQAMKEIAVGKLSGAVGGYNHLNPLVEERALHNLGLKPEVVSTQIIPRDRHAMYFHTLSLLASGIERLVTNIRLLNRSDVDEIRESFGESQRGSSAMPHKKNPIVSENLCGLTRIVKNLANAADDNIPLWHERDISHSSAERHIAPDITSLVFYMLVKTEELIKGLYVNENIMSNRAESHYKVYSETILLKLISKGMSRNKAYLAVQRNAMAVDIKAAIQHDAEIIKYLSNEEINECFNSNSVLKNNYLLIERALKLE